MLRNKTFVSWLILLSLVLVWGSSFILMKKGLHYFKFNELAALRLSIAAIVLIPFAVFRFKKLSFQDFTWIFISGFLGNGIPAFLFAKAQTRLDSSIAGVLNSLTPLFTLLIGVFLFNQKTKWYKIFGIIIGLTGAAGLILNSSSSNMEVNYYYSGMIVLATFCYSVNINIIQSKLRNVTSYDITSFALISVGIPLLVYLLTATPFISKASHDPKIWNGILIVAILGVFGSALSLIVFNYLIKITNAVFSSSVTYMMPVVALLWGVFDGEKLYMVYFLWIAFILTGVFLANFRFSKSEI